MSLFPAYSSGDDVHIHDEVMVGVTSPGESGVEAREAKLLASDSDGESTAGAVSMTRATSPPCDYYTDVKADCGNLAVSTLYYPGRPEYYHPRCDRRDKRHRETRATRYYETPPTHDSHENETAVRAACLLRALTDSPRDETLWLHYIDFEESCRDGGAALQAAERGVAAMPESRALRSALHRVRVRVLPPARLLTVLRDACSTVTSSPTVALESWLRLLNGIATTGSLDEMTAAAAAAITRLRRDPAAYPHILYVYGSYLREAGLWERLVLLVELVTAMNCPANAGFPPPGPDAAQQHRTDQHLATMEDEMVACGLPLNTVWTRVERARASAHWRPAPSATDAAGDCDPQRRAMPPDVAELLVPVTDPSAVFLLCVQLLRMVKIPVLPCAQYVRRGLGGAGLADEDLGGCWDVNGGEVLLSLLRAARHLPPAHPAHSAHYTRPGLAGVLMTQFLDPPHYFTDRAGYLSWVNALWGACTVWADTPDRRLAMLCWRLRWLHALLLMIPTQEKESDTSETRRILSEARGILKRYGDGSPLAYAQYARIQAAGVGAGLVAGDARHTVMQAMRAALCDVQCAQTHRLYVARVALQLGVDTLWPVVCAVLGQQLPDRCGHATSSPPPPPPHIIQRALDICEERCTEIEMRWSESRDDSTSRSSSAESVLLPGLDEWSCARVVLSSTARQSQLLRKLLQRCTSGTSATSCGVADVSIDNEQLRYLEQSACALVCAGAKQHTIAQRARLLHPYWPHNAFLALASGGGGGVGSVWRLCGDATHCASVHRLRALTTCTRTHVAALSYVLPALLRAVDTDWTSAECDRLVRACSRASRHGYGGALLHHILMHADAHASRPHTQRVVLHALDRLPNNKWSYVRGTAWSPTRDAASLPDILLDRQLRLHALLEELRPLPTRHRDTDLTQRLEIDRQSL